MGGRTKLINKLIKYLENRAKKKLGGIPLMWLIYNPEQPIPNMIFKLHPSIEHDEYLQREFKAISDYVRDKYSHEWKL